LLSSLKNTKLKYRKRTNHKY